MPKHKSTPAPETVPAGAFPAPGHNHHRCLSAALRRAARAFEDKGMRLTPLRRAVFAQIAASHHAVGAYELIDRLGEDGKRPTPVSVYRALDALREAGVIHRLESGNAFFACHADHGGDGPGCSSHQIALLCTGCGIVAELPGDAVFDAISQASGAVQFASRDVVIEVNGLCRYCSSQAETAGET